MGGERWGILTGTGNPIRGAHQRLHHILSHLFEIFRIRQFGPSDPIRLMGNLPFDDDFLRSLSLRFGFRLSELCFSR